MDKNIIEDIDNLYKIIKENIGLEFKIIAVNKFINKYHLSLRRISEFFNEEIYVTVKNTGTVYTPINISNYILKNTINKEDIIKNPYLKICDLACGSGNMLLPLYDILLNIYSENIEEIEKKNSINIKDIRKHIIKNNIYGYDIDSLPLKVLTIDFFIETGSTEVNLYNKDFLFCDKEEYDVFISNPPYVGHKAMDKNYSRLLKQKYKDVYLDKGDISYCFFQEALNSLRKGGKLTFITSRYFLEAPSGEELRKILKDYCSLTRIVDFYGIRPFKNAGIDPVIIFLMKNGEENSEIEVIKPKSYNKKLFLDALLNEKVIGKDINKFYINKNLLNNKGWILRGEKERNIIRKIEEKSFTNLRNICISYQGIITGCDKAFIVDEELIREHNIEKSLLKPWIKSSNIEKFKVRSNDKYVIYSDFIETEKDYPNAIDYIGRMRHKLIERRECKSNARRWYQLQWGRDSAIFEKEKIIFPYKSSNNRFAIDKNNYFSADIYALVLKEDVPFTYEYLLRLLNSDIYEFYFKTFGKKLGDNLYEYYPNNLLKLCIPTMDMDDNYDLYKLFDLNEDEIKIIKGIE